MVWLAPRRGGGRGVENVLYMQGLTGKQNDSGKTCREDMEPGEYGRKTVGRGGAERIKRRAVITQPPCNIPCTYVCPVL
jgi:hypothetical protein